MTDVKILEKLIKTCNFPGVIDSSHLPAFNSFQSSITFSDSVFMAFTRVYLFLLTFFWNFFLLGFGGSFMAPSPSPVTPAQNNLLQPNFEAAFGTTPSTSSSSSFDPSGETVVFKHSFNLF